MKLLVKINAISLNYLFLFFLCLQGIFCSFLLELAVRGLEEAVRQATAPRLVQTPPTTVSNVDEDFEVVLGGSVQDLLRESEFDRINSEIHYFLEQVLAVDRSYQGKIHLIERIKSWDVSIASARMEHFKAFTIIVTNRHIKYIPDSLLVEYLKFLAKISDGLYECTEKMVRLTIHMIKSGEKPKILHFAVESLKSNYVQTNQVFSLFQSVFCLLSSVSNEVNTITAVVGKYLRIFLLIYENFNITQWEFDRLRSRHPESRIFTAFLDLMPLYSLIISNSRSHAQIMHRLDNICFEVKVERFWYWKFFDVLLQKSRFVNNFNCSPKRAAEKGEIFLRIIANMGKNLHLIELLEYSVNNRLFYMFEALLIFSPKDEYFYLNVVGYLKKILIKRRTPLFIYMVLISNCPEINEDLLDELIVECFAVESNRGSFNAYSIYCMKRIIRAIESIPENLSTSPIIWNMSDSLQLLLHEHSQPVRFRNRRGTHDDFDPKEENFYYAAQILLSRHFDIPFCRTNFQHNFAEEVDWSEMIGFVNFMLEREAQSFKVDIEYIPIFSTNNK